MPSYIKNYKINQQKFILKLSLVFFQVIERLCFLISNICGAYVLVNLIRGTFEFSLETFIRIFLYLGFDYLASCVFSSRVRRYNRGKNQWKRMNPLNIKNYRKIKNLPRKSYFFFLSQLKDYYMYTYYLIILIVLFLIFIICNSLRISILFWLTSSLISWYFIIKSSNFKILTKLKLLKIKFNKYQFLNTYLIVLLIISFILFASNSNLSIFKSIIAIFGFRQILASIRSILLKKSALKISV